MDKLRVHLENCYGIQKLVEEFDFSDCRTIVVYVPNGVMKSSFAKTFDDISQRKEPCDQMDESAVSVFNITIDETGDQITPEEICVIHPYNEKAFDSEDKVSTLLADEELREKYLNVYEELDSRKQLLIKNLKKVSGSTNCEQEVVETFSPMDNPRNIFEIFTEILANVKTSNETFTFGNYNDIFDKEGKVKEFLKSNKDLVGEYFEKYENLIKKSEFFAKNEGIVFGTTEANNISKSMEGNAFFLAGHKLNLKKYGDVVDTQRFTEILDEEVNKIFNNVDLKETYKKIDDKLNKHAVLRKFKKTIENHPTLLIRLIDYDKFKKEVWFSYLKELEMELENLVALYVEKKSGLEEIVEEANTQQSRWKDAIDEFHNRFVNMPFTLIVDNQSDAILNTRKPVILFEFEGKQIDRNKLIHNVLSQGEKRAFYILNIVFEIRAREIQNQKTLFVIDDIADSFDYKNKFAIVEYLNDLAKNSNFYSIIFTHNFDFYRTVSQRLGLPRKNKRHAIKHQGEIKIGEEVYQNAPFLTWRKNMKSGAQYDIVEAKKHILALIPFVRNLVEYSGKATSSTTYGKDYETLTNLLHSKENTKRITFGDLKLIYKLYLGANDFDASIRDSDLVYDEIFNVANSINDDEFNLENKIVLAMAIRHKAEEYMFSSISDNLPVSGDNQTRILFEKYQKEFSEESSHRENLVVLEEVNIMTPENIHINSFMYEPILDMGIDELKNLYGNVCNLI